MCRFLTLFIRVGGRACLCLGPRNGNFRFGSGRSRATFGAILRFISILIARICIYEWSRMSVSSPIIRITCGFSKCLPIARSVLSTLAGCSSGICPVGVSSRSTSAFVMTLSCTLAVIEQVCLSHKLNSLTMCFDVRLFLIVALCFIFITTKTI